MFENLNFSLSPLSLGSAQLAELALLYPVVDQRWQQKFDRLVLLITVRDQGTLIAAGLVHDSILAPTEVMDAVELGCMAVRPEYRRRGIRQHVTKLRLEFAVRSGKTPIIVIDAQNPASWAFYERSELWERERSFEQDGRLKFIYRATQAARGWVDSLPQAAEREARILSYASRPRTVRLVAHPPIRALAAEPLHPLGERELLHAGRWV